MNLDPIRIRELEASLEAHRLLLTNVSARAEDARGQLVRIGRELCGDEFDRFLGALGDLEYVSAEELASNVINALKNHSSTNPANGEKQIKDLQKEIEALKERLDKQTRRADDAERILSDSTNLVKVLEKNLMEERSKSKELSAQLPPVEQPISEAVDFSGWFEEWSREKSFERNQTILVFLGESGLARQKEIVDRLLQESNLKTRTIYSGLDDCVEDGLLERRAGTSSGGHPTDLICLTAKGQWTYTRLTGNRPVPNEYEGLLKAHKSDKHTGLILKTADHFARLGYSVQREPIAIKLAGDHVYQPDLVVQKDDETFYLEVETGEKIDRASLERKWQNAMVVGGGRICVVAPMLGSMTMIQSNIVQWAREKGKVPRLYLTNLDALRKCQPGDSPWVRVRS
jgi:hypothetical protein